MKIERMSIYNIYGITSKEKSLLYNSLHEFKRMFGDGDQTSKDIILLMEKLRPTEDAESMSREVEKSAIKSAQG